MDVNPKSSDICVPFEVPIDVRKLIRSRGEHQGKGDKMQWYKELKGDGGTGRA